MQARAKRELYDTSWMINRTLRDLVGTSRDVVGSSRDPFGKKPRACILPQSSRDRRWIVVGATDLAGLSLDPRGSKRCKTAAM